MDLCSTYAEFQDFPSFHKSSPPSPKSSCRLGLYSRLSAVPYGGGSFDAVPTLDSALELGAGFSGVTLVCSLVGAGS